jgi:hypothetical protein
MYQETPPSLHCGVGYWQISLSIFTAMHPHLIKISFFNAINEVVEKQGFGQSDMVIVERRGGSINNPPIVLDLGKCTQMATLRCDPNTLLQLCIEAKSNTKTGELCMYLPSNSWKKILFFLMLLITFDF